MLSCSMMRAFLVIFFCSATMTENNKMKENLKYQAIIYDFVVTVEDIHILHIQSSSFKTNFKYQKVVAMKEWDGKWLILFLFCEFKFHLNYQNSNTQKTQD